MFKYLRYLVLSFSLVLAEPMEPLTNYNVIMVHGAADNVSNGFECNDKEAQTEPYVYASGDSWSLGGAPGMIGSYTATDKLTHWLDRNIFENRYGVDSSSIYIQRSFTKPAGSPFENGKEIGKSSWQCGGRRSLIEEAQEVKAEGRTKLAELREDVTKRNQLPPSRNIIVSHSMGGVAAREYVQGKDYNNDVDKVITLDSPNEGTGALNLFLQIKSFFSKKGTPLFKTPFRHAQLATRKNTLKNEASLMSVSRTSALQFIFFDVFFATSCDVAFNTKNHLFSMPYIPEPRRRYEKHV